MNKQRYLIKTGEFAGQVFDGEQCFARATPDSEPNPTIFGEGIWIPQLSLRFPKIRDASSSEWGHSEHYQDLVIPFDKYGKEIFEGSSLYASVKNEVREVKVVKINEVYHAGYGHITRKLRVTDVDTGKTLTLSEPAHTIKI